ncbi:OmpA family protein [Caballeronia insecticola]|uniref:OmpA/MotB domain protein n=1 Tax=Caballeronia insecticola TaxID=758793 RepID=R4WKH2_9BURK|nr:OmpA family protein [Caballeronia insecticola]BAN25048.1 OmpA/MotB domain protein [Caballeronia insecticola]
MSINLVQAVNSAFSENIAEQLSQQFGIPAQVVRQVTARVAPGLVASLMDRATLVPGAQSIFSVIMQPETDAHMIDQFSRLISTTGGLKQLEAVGHSLAAVATGRRIDALTDTVSAETGVPTQATSSLAGIVAAVLFGVLKRHFLLAQWSVAHLPRLLREQVSEVNASMSNAVASSIGVGNTEGFTGSIAARLEAAASNLAQRDFAQRPSSESAVAIGAEPSFKTGVQAAPVASAVVSAQPSAQTLRPPVRKRTPQQRSNKWVWLLFAVLAAVLAALFYYGFAHDKTISLGAAPATQPVANAVESAASAVSLDAQPAVVAPASASVSASSAEASSAAVASPSATAQPDAASQASSADAKDAQLVFNGRPTGGPSIQATVGSEAEKTQLIDALTSRFGKSYTANVSVVPGTRPANWLAHLTNLAPLMAVPGAEAKLTGSKVELSGTAADAKLGWVDRLKASLGNAFQVSSFDAESAVAGATQSFQDAIKTLLAANDSCSGDKLTKVLDLQVVNFARSSAQVPDSANATLGKTAKLLKDCAAKGSMVNLEIAGYSDSQGAAPAKLEVSKERAHAVRGFLVREGVPPQSLTAEGYGDARPVADNETASGRFSNRRIEFVVKKN